MNNSAMRFLDNKQSYNFSGKQGLTADDKKPHSTSDTIIVFFLEDNTEILHAVSSDYGMGWCIRHAREIGKHSIVLRWYVKLGNGVVIAESMRKR